MCLHYIAGVTILPYIFFVFFRYEAMWDAIYNLSLAEDSIHPEKYVVSDMPAIRDFPARHPNKPLAVVAHEDSKHEL